MGLTYEVSEKLQLAASIKDVGKINWKNNVVNYQSNKTIAYGGIVLDSILQDSNIPLSETLDSLSEVIAFTETNENYSSTLPLKSYWSASYKMSDTWTFGGLIHTASFEGQTDIAFALSGRAHLSKMFAVGASYALRNERYDNLGLNFTLNLGPVAIYAMTDNVLAVIQPDNSRSINLRAGLNLGF